MPNDDLPDWILEDVKRALKEKGKTDLLPEHLLRLDARMLSKEQILAQFEHASLTDFSSVAPSPVAMPQQASEDDDGNGASLWLICFTDCMALMLTFFVLLYSMSVPQENKWKHMLQSFDETLVPYKTLDAYSGSFDFTSVAKKSYQPALNLNYLASLLEEQFNGEGGVGPVYISHGSDRIVISLLSNFSFDADASQLSTTGRSALIRLAEVLSNITNRVEIIGRATSDNDGASYDADDWSLSLSKAIKVAAFLKQAGYGMDLAVRGASNAADTIVSDEALPDEIRDEMSRRVDLVIMNDNGKLYKFHSAVSPD